MCRRWGRLGDGVGGRWEGDVRDSQQVGALGRREEVGDVDDEGRFRDHGDFVGRVGADVVVEVSDGGLVIGDDAGEDGREGRHKEGS